jgi:hypothetical protein
MSFITGEGDMPDPDKRASLFPRRADPEPASRPLPGRTRKSCSSPLTAPVPYRKRLFCLGNPEVDMAAGGGCHTHKAL